MDRATQKIDMPAGGIGDFIYTDEELDLLEANELEEAFGKDGIAQFKDVGKKIAEYGRYGDDTVAHVYLNFSYQNYLRVLRKVLVR